MTDTTDLFYTNGFEHLQDEKKRLDLIFTIHAKNRQRLQTDDPSEQLGGLIISDVEIDRIINEYPLNEEQQQEIAQLYQELNEINTFIHVKLEKSQENGVFLPIPYLIEQFQLSLFEEECLLFALAPELEKKYEKLLAYVQNDVNQTRPTIDFLLHLICTSEEEKAKALSTFHNEGNFLRFLVDRTYFDKSEKPLMSRQLNLDSRIISFIMQSTVLDKRIKQHTKLFYPNEELSKLLVGQPTLEKIIRFIENTGHPKLHSNKSIAFYCNGPQGAGKTFICKHVSKYFGQPLVLLDVKKAIIEEDYQTTIFHVIREAELNKAMLVIENIETLLEDNQHSQKKLQMLLYALTYFSDFVFITSTLQTKKMTTLFYNFLLVEASLDFPSMEEREMLWQTKSHGYTFEEPIDCSILAVKFRFTPGQIENALFTAEKLSEWNSFGKEVISVQTLYRACYLQIQHRLENKATRIKPKYTWDDLVLPDDEKKLLRNASSQLKYRNLVFGKWGFDKKISYGKGLSILLSGPPGTGKTMSAEVIANDLNIELYRVDLSQVISKYIGETEKNLKEIFDEGKLSNAILFFDEADALFSKRSEVNDSKDKYANMEVSFLLQKMEEYDGISVLATNHLQNFDEAFLRRITYIIKYSFPDETHREKIWKSLIPPEAPTDDIDFKFLASKINLAGGNIKNIVVSAAFLAADRQEPISMQHLIYASKHEMQKSGKILLREDLGEYYDLL